jgi:hypothetical protein
MNSVIHITGDRDPQFEKPCSIQKAYDYITRRSEGLIYFSLFGVTLRI